MRYVPRREDLARLLTVFALGEKTKTIINNNIIEENEKKYKEKQ